VRGALRGALRLLVRLHRQGGRRVPRLRHPGQRLRPRALRVMPRRVPDRLLVQRLRVVSLVRGQARCRARRFPARRGARGCWPRAVGVFDPEDAPAVLPLHRKMLGRLCRAAVERRIIDPWGINRSWDTNTTALGKATGRVATSYVLRAPPFSPESRSRPQAPRQPHGSPTRIAPKARPLT
jgi:hypothetical protein